MFETRISSATSFTVKSWSSGMAPRRVWAIATPATLGYRNHRINSLNIGNRRTLVEPNAPADPPRGLGGVPPPGRLPPLGERRRLDAGRRAVPGDRRRRRSEAGPVGGLVGRRTGGCGLRRG